MVDSCLGKHGHVFDFGLSQVWAVGGNKDHLSLTLSKGLQGVLVSQDGLAGFHHQLKATVHRVLLLLLYSPGEAKYQKIKREKKNKSFYITKRNHRG